MAHTSNIILLKNVSLSMDYADTLLFDNVSAQTSFFLTKQAYAFHDLMYIKPGTIYIPDQAGQYRTCTYLMYTNPDYPDKWFYAFIAGVEYLADGTTRISYIEDFLQTWFFEMNVGPCMVQREHVNNDAVGANLKEENVALGDYVVTNSGIYPILNWTTIVGSAVAPSTPDITAYADVMQGMINGLEWIKYGQYEDGMIRLRSDLDNLASVGKSDAIVNIWSVPSLLLTNPLSGDGNNLNDNLVDTKPTTISPVRPTNLNGYVPKNNKLFTYPYCALNVGTNSGQNVVLRYEFFNGNPKLQMAGSIAPNGRLMLIPLNYAGVSENYDFSVSMGDYPQGSWTQDVYSNWLATQSIKWDYESDRRQLSAGFEHQRQFRSAIEGVLANAVQNNTSGVISAGLNGVSGMIENAINYEQNEVLAQNAISQEKEMHSIIPPATKGSIGADVTLFALGKYSFKWYGKTITYNYAESIDNYFSLYGYRVDTVKIPNFSGRKSWNFVQTIGAIVTGNAPLYAREGFRGLLNKGIRFWHGDYIGDYTRDNSIIGG